jgi:hypothetical protein
MCFVGFAWQPIPDLQIHCLCSGLTGMEPEKLKAQFGLNIEDYETSQFGYVCACAAVRVLSCAIDLTFVCARAVVRVR